MSKATLNWVEVATLDDLWEGEMLAVEMNGEKVLLAHLPGGEIVAYQGTCPHQEYPLAEGELDEETRVLTCSGHHWQFNILTGQGVNTAQCTLYCYEVKVEGETISVGYPEDATLQPLQRGLVFHERDASRPGDKRPGNV
jgi:toluene monooxygenase system ferredoxin subunit